MLASSNDLVLCLQETLVLAASNDFASRVWSLGDQRLRVSGHVYSW